MSVPEKTISQTAPSKVRRLRTIGTAILLVGLSSAWFVYWQGTRQPDAADDMSIAGFDRAHRRQMAQLYGKSGAMIQDLTDNIGRPGVQAGIIATISVIAAGGCFYFAPFAGIAKEPPGADRS